MKVSIDWLKELVDFKQTPKELAKLIPQRVQGGTKTVTDQYIELDLKGYNRADLLSLRGVAYEVAAITNSEVKFIEFDPKIQNSGGLRVDLESKNCVFYCLAKITGLKVGASPSEWQKKLIDSGMRSINNITDITNLIMLEYGQPLHAFDAQKVREEHIIVRHAKPNEKLVTLDSKERTLTHDDLVIADFKKPLGIAGIMGGKDSEVSDNTQTILLEAAIFSGKMLRKTSQRLGIQSEASKRFQHGLTKTRLLQAFAKALEEYKSLAGEVTGITIRGDIIDKTNQIDLNLAKVDNLIGVKIPALEIKSYLERLYFKVNSKSPLDITTILNVERPYFRLDIEGVEDLIEEIARMYGYEKIPAQELKGELPDKIDDNLFKKFAKVTKTLVDLGLNEVQTYSFYSTKVTENLKLKTENLVRVANPISSETEYLRANVWPNLVESVVKNLKSFEDVAIFEIGKSYKLGKKGPDEGWKLAIALANNSDNPILELHQIFKHLIQNLDWEIEIREELEVKCQTDYFHPTRVSCLDLKGKMVGVIAEVHQRVINRLGSEKRIAILEINLDLLKNLA